MPGAPRSAICRWPNRPGCGPAPSSRLEIELDEGSAWRLGPESQVEISDYSRLSTGQRLTLLSLDHGVAYFTGEPGGTDTLTLAVPGAQVTLLRGARVRLQVDATMSQISVIEGMVRLSCPAAELDMREGQTVRVEPANPARFWLDREVPAMDLDRWSEERDKALATSSSGSHVAQRYGVVDLDAAGEWVQTDLGAVWKPKVAEGWAPFQNGRWRWYDALGYTWVSDEAWGWLPYHYGRWTRKGDLGWVWVPPASPVFKPGDVYWLHNAKLAGWGPLAPGEDWQPSAAPEQFLNVNTTYANFQQDARAIDPAGFKDRPKEPLGVAVFALALPSPAFLASRSGSHAADAARGRHARPAGDPGDHFPGHRHRRTAAATAATMPPAVVTNPASDAPPTVAPGPPPDPGPPGPPMQVIYPVPVYTGIVVLNPPEHPDYSRRNPNSPSGKGRSPHPHHDRTHIRAPAHAHPTGGPTPPVSRPPLIHPPGQPGQPGTPTNPGRYRRLRRRRRHRPHRQPGLRRRARPHRRRTRGPALSSGRRPCPRRSAANCRGFRGPSRSRRASPEVKPVAKVEAKADVKADTGQVKKQ